MPYPRIVKGGVALVLGTLATAVAALGQTGGLTGKATLQDGSPCVKCPVIIERQEIKGVYKTKTDKKGSYVYVGLQPGNYKVTLQDPDGKTLFFITHHVELGDPTEVNFDLAKEMAQQKQEQQKAIESNPELKKHAEEQAKEQKQFAGLKQLYDQGQALRNQKDYAGAAAAFEQAIPMAKEKNLLAVTTLAADSYSLAKNYPKAIELYQKALAINPNDAALHNGLGSVYANTGKVAEAQAEFEKSAQVDPANASRAYYNLGAIMYNAGKMDEAAAAFKKATQADPKYADAYFLMGRALMGKLSMSPDGKPLPAPGTVEAFQTYLQLDPNGKYAAEAQQDLQAITGSVQTEMKVKKKKNG